MAIKVRSELASAVLASGLSYRSIANASHVERAHFSKILHRVVIPKRSTAERISKVLGRPVGEIFPDVVTR